VWCVQKPCHPLFNIGLEAVRRAHEYFEPLVPKARCDENDIDNKRTVEQSEQLQ